jgi:transcriptional regulator with XRE-family HTH domain
MLDFQERFREALRLRLFPNASVHLKEIAGAIGRSENTVTRWWRGETRVNGEDLDRIANFFCRRGDRNFLEEVFGSAIAAGATSAGSVEDKALALVRAAFAEAGQQSRFSNDYNVWFTANGAMEPAEQGHSEYVRRTLSMPEGAGDLIGYATRVLGWIGLVDRADGVVVFRHDARRVARLAAERACEWLDDRADRISLVRRSVHMEGRWIEATHAGAHLAASAIAKVALISRVLRRPWRVAQLPLASITDPRLLALLRAHNEGPENLIHAAAEMGAFTTSHVFGVSGDNVTSRHVATQFGFDPRTIEGFNVLSRPDTDYALMVQSRVLRTKRDGANYCELTGTIDGNYVRYLNLALPEPGPEGRVLTSTVIVELTPLAA